MTGVLSKAATTTADPCWDRRDEKFTTIPPVGMRMSVEALPMEVVKGATKRAPQDDSGSGTK